MTEENPLAKYVPEIAKQKERDSRKKKEKKHDPSVEKEGPKFKCFNVADHKSVHDDLIGALNEIADKYDVNHIDLSDTSGYNGKWNDRDWSWKSRFFAKYIEHYEDTVDYETVPHYRYWLDSLIDQCSRMVWDLVQKTEVRKHAETGIVPKTDLSKKKGRDNILMVSDYLADKELVTFEEKFR